MKARALALRAITAFAFVFTALVLIAAFTPAANWLARPLVAPTELMKADAVVVLGGGAYGDGTLGGASNERLIRGLLLYKGGYARKVVFAGSTITKTSLKVANTVLDSGGQAYPDVSEAGKMYDMAVRLGMPAVDLYVEPLSANTYENLVNSRRLMDEKGLKSCLLVTSPTHARRALAVAAKLGLACSPAPVADYTGLRTGAADRIGLSREVVWEYAALVLYRLYGYI